MPLWPDAISTVPPESHLAQYDDREVYFEGLIEFIEGVDAGRF